MRFAFWVALAASSVIALPASAGVIVALNTPAPLSFTDSTGTGYSLTAFQPAGSGVFLPFMRISHPTDSQGYNSSLNNTPSATMDLINLPGNSSSQLPLNHVVTSDGRVFLTLDYNEQGAAGKSLIRLTELTLVVSSDANKTGPVGPKNNDPWVVQNIPMSGSDQIVYQMSTANDGLGNSFVIQMDADNNPANGNGGSGAADLNVAVNLAGVPNLAALLAGGNKYLYVYSRFNGVGAGFEEWNSFDIINNPGGGGGQGNSVPEPATLGVLGLAAVALLSRRRK